MVLKKEIAELRDDLIARRDTALQLREKLRESWEELREPAVEPEEAGVKAKRARTLERMENRHDRELTEIEDALKRIEYGGYGVCESCENPISLKRLKSVPWTGLCAACAGEQDAREQGGEAETEPLIETGPPPDLGGATDEEIEEAAWDLIRRDERINPAQLNIAAEGGRLRLEGVAASEREHAVLTELISETLGFKDFDDRMKIDRLAVREFFPPPEHEIADKEIMTHGEPVRTDPQASIEDGEPLSPPDRFRPENEE